MKDFDKYIKNELNKSVEDSSPSDYLKNKIDLEINSQGEKGEFKMKKRFVLVAAAALVLSVGVFAAGKLLEQFHPHRLNITTQTIPTWLRQKRRLALT